MIPTYEQCMAEAHARRVTYRVSDCGNFCIFNYAPMVEIKKWWNDINIWCRGLIFDLNDTSTPVAVPFKKFWNVGQKPETQPEVLALLGMPVAVQDKLDGSLGIVFWDRHANRPRVSTRGSLESNQSKWATKWLNEQPASTINLLRQELRDNGMTLLAEIIYPSNRIVVRYEYSGMVVLDWVHNATGVTSTSAQSVQIVPDNFRPAAIYPIQSITHFLERAQNLPGMVEGFVMTYRDGLKVKIKGQEYIRLHRIRFDLTPRRVYELLTDYTDIGEIQPTLDTLLTAVPDEFADPVRRVATTLADRYNAARESVAWHAETARQEGRGERKRMALYGKDNLPKELLGAFFADLDGDLEKSAKLTWRGVDYTDQII